MNIYRVFTLDSGVAEGAIVGTFTLSNGTKIPAITVGTSGRGRSLGVLSVHLPKDLYAEWKEKSRVKVFSGKIGKTKAGNFKLFAEKEPTTDEKIIAIMPTKIGYRGGNSHTGDRAEEYWVRDWSTSEYEEAGIPIQDRYTRDEVREYSQLYVTHKYGGGNYRWDAGFSRKLRFAEFPGEVLVKGSIAQGAAGRMGSGIQMVTLLPKDIWFRTGYSGRLYGGPAAHYYVWNGQEMTCLTWEERQLLEATDEVEEVEWL